MDVHIQEIQSTDAGQWDAYVHSHPQATLYHLYGWRNVIEKTYGHKTYYLAAIKDVPSKPSSIQHPASSNQYPVTSIQYPASSIQFVGLLPLVHLKHFLFGNSLISMPFVDMGGILADDEETEQAFLLHAIKLGRKLGATTIELRNAQPLSCLNSTNSTDSTSPSNPINPISVAMRSHKVRMLLDLPNTSDILLKSFKSKLRSQIRKPMKERLTTRIGRNELMGDFYEVFSINMRDLGSPVHSINLMRHVLEEFPAHAKIVVVYGNDCPMACGLIVGFKDVLENPWASSLRKCSHLSPNMLLYWSMLEYACKNGFARFDFGRSTPGEGTFKFKEQWGAKPAELHWYYIPLKGQQISDESTEKSRFESFITCWQKLPVPVTRLIGPMIRKHVGL
jgi:serine/alanine adding enzyme